MTELISGFLGLLGRDVPYGRLDGRLALVIWASSILETAALTALTVWMAVVRSDAVPSLMLAGLAVVCLIVGRAAKQSSAVQMKR